MQPVFSTRYGIELFAIFKNKGKKPWGVKAEMSLKLVKNKKIHSFKQVLIFGFAYLWSHLSYGSILISGVAVVCSVCVGNSLLLRGCSGWVNLGHDLEKNFKNPLFFLSIPTWLK